MPAIIKAAIHCATHLPENETNLRYIQKILGHSSSKSTEIYTYVSINKKVFVYKLTMKGIDLIPTLLDLIKNNNPEIKDVKTVTIPIRKKKDETM